MASLLKKSSSPAAAAAAAPAPEAPASVSPEAPAAPAESPSSDPGIVPPKNPSANADPYAKPAAAPVQLDLIPEKFRNAADPLGEFAKGYESLASMVGKKDEELRAAVTAELEAKRKEGLPADASAYVLPKIEGVAVDEKALAEHPLIDWWRTTAHARGLDQTAFDEGVQKYVSALAEKVPNPDVEMKKLGENAVPRLEAVGLWANQTFQGEEFDAISEFASTAAGVKVLEKLMRGGVAAGTRPDEAAQESGDDEATIRGLMSTPAYSHPARRDPKVVARVDAFFKKKYGAQS